MEASKPNTFNHMVYGGISKPSFTIIKEWVDKDFRNRSYEVTFKKGKDNNEKFVCVCTIIVKNTTENMVYTAKGYNKYRKAAKEYAAINFLKKYPSFITECILPPKNEKQEFVFRDNTFNKMLSRYNRFSYFTFDEYIPCEKEYTNTNGDLFDDDEEMCKEKEEWNKLSCDEKIKILDDEINTYFFVYDYKKLVDDLMKYAI